MITLKGLKAKVDYLAFAPDGKMVLASSHERHTAAWSLPEGGQPIRLEGLVGVLFSGESTVFGVTYHASNLPRHLGWMRLHPGTEFTPSIPADHYLHNPYCIRLSPDKARLAACVGGQVRWWSWPDFAPLPAWTLERCGAWCIADLRFSPTGATVAVFQHDGLTLHDTATGRILWTAEVKADRNFGCVAWAPDGRWIAAGGGKRLRVIDAKTGRHVAETAQASKHFLDAEFTPDGRFLATVSNEKTVKFFDTDSWTLRHELAWQNGGLRAIAFSPDGMLAAAGGAGKQVVVWDLDL